ncbi:MAG: DUF1801 domain-containing protein [Candidatus Pristimantibacillus lignocellulolyticus]|uniref:DUF1801 domain-containing protein n=1 Tax=Candidatus Pristimantibacillus lignocellulolyticus TaxID=2994561 RepID=A0A9J6ZGZ4_9BACL|nr:MAG: DUF1801 domain-containing protein [Candidatus Pristimantibacillus lignocellulolyticus]
MNEKKVVYQSVDQYIAEFPAKTQEILQSLRKKIKQLTPEATEKISYQMPTFALHGNLVHFAAYKNHIGFYPGASGIKAFEHALSSYKSAKGSVQFPINEPLPFDLISEIVKYRVADNIARHQEKSQKKSQNK